MKKWLFLLIFIISLDLSSASLKINEIMFDPKCPDEHCEYIEIYNDNDFSIDLVNYSIGDSNSNDTIEGAFKEDKYTILPAFSYAIITDQDTRIYNNFEIPKNMLWLYVDDESIGNGLSKKETIYLYDPNSEIIDTVEYDCETNGKSLSYLDNTWKEQEPTPGKSNEKDDYLEDYSKVKITEFFPNPEGEDNAPMPEGEWIELYNEDDNSIDLTGFEFYDDYGSEPDVIVSKTTTLSGTIIKPSSYLVIYSNGKSGFLNNDGFERIKFFDKYNKLIDEVTYSGSEEALSWSFIDGKWEKARPSPNLKNQGNKSEINTEIKIEELYDLGNDKKAEWGDIIRIKLFLYKGNTEKDVLWIWIEDSGTVITKKSKFNILNKFQNYTITFPLMIPDNCDDDFEDGKYKIIIEGFDQKDEKEIEIRDKPLCKETSSKKSKFEYEILEIPEKISISEEFTTDIRLKNNQKEDIKLQIWSYPYSGKKKFVEKEETDNIEDVLLKPDEEKIVSLENKVSNTDKDSLNFKVKILKSDRKTPIELKENISIIKNQDKKEFNPVKETSNETQSKTLKNPITGYLIYENSSQKTKNKAILFFSGVGLMLLIYLILKNGI